MEDIEEKPTRVPDKCHILARFNLERDVAQYSQTGARWIAKAKNILCNASLEHTIKPQNTLYF